jgi:hypothetical protein
LLFGYCCARKAKALLMTMYQIDKTKATDRIQQK